MRLNQTPWPFSQIEDFWGERVYGDNSHSPLNFRPPMELTAAR